MMHSSTDRAATRPAMPPRSSTPVASPALKAIKAAHTIVWALLAGCVVAIPLASLRGAHRAAAWLAAIVAGEVVVLLVFGGRCPLTLMAARYTDDRRDNFDIYLPAWLARNNKLIFGALYVAGSCSRWRERRCSARARRTAGSSRQNFGHVSALRMRAGS